MDPRGPSVSSGHGRTVSVPPRFHHPSAPPGQLTDSQGMPRPRSSCQASSKGTQVARPRPRSPGRRESWAYAGSTCAASWPSACSWSSWLPPRAGAGGGGDRLAPGPPGSGAGRAGASHQRRFAGPAPPGEGEPAPFVGSQAEADRLDLEALEERAERARDDLDAARAVVQGLVVDEQRRATRLAALPELIARAASKAAQAEEAATRASVEQVEAATRAAQEARATADLLGAERAAIEAEREARQAPDRRCAPEGGGGPGRGGLLVDAARGARGPRGDPRAQAEGGGAGGARRDASSARGPRRP